MPVATSSFLLDYKTGFCVPNYKRKGNALAMPGSSDNPAQSVELLAGWPGLSRSPGGMTGAAGASPGLRSSARVTPICTLQFVELLQAAVRVQHRLRQPACS